MQKLLIRKVSPVYPQEARQKHIHGTVVLKAIIGHGGDIQELTVISGDPVLVPAALDAGKQWKYRPYLFDGQPVDVETQLMMNFR